MILAIFQVKLFFAFVEDCLSKGGKLLGSLLKINVLLSFRNYFNTISTDVIIWFLVRSYLHL